MIRLSGGILKESRKNRNKLAARKWGWKRSKTLLNTWKRVYHVWDFHFKGLFFFSLTFFLNLQCWISFQRASVEMLTLIGAELLRFRTVRWARAWGSDWASGICGTRASRTRTRTTTSSVRRFILATTHPTSRTTSPCCDSTVMSSTRNTSSPSACPIRMRSSPNRRPPSPAGGAPLTVTFFSDLKLVWQKKWKRIH